MRTKRTRPRPNVMRSAMHGLYQFFFEIRKDQFFKLQLIPINHRLVVDDYTTLGYRSARMREMLQGIYREHG